VSAYAATAAGRCPAGDRIEPGDLVVEVNDDVVHLECEGVVLAALDDGGTAA
jgi:hypothetical protein